MHFDLILLKKHCVTLIDFLLLIKRVPQFLIKGELFIERERGERDTKTVLEEYAARGTEVCSRLEVPPGYKAK